jgi:hypothetical protein
LPLQRFSPLLHWLLHVRVQLPEPVQVYPDPQPCVLPHFQQPLLSVVQAWYPLPLHLFCPELQSLLQLAQLPPLQYWPDEQLVTALHL